MIAKELYDRAIEQQTKDKSAKVADVGWGMCTITDCVPRL
jgi:hypothetical protein